MRFIVVAAMFLGLLPQAIAGQVLADARLAAAARSLPARAAIRIATAGTKVSGEFLRAQRDSLTFRVGTSERRMGFAGIDTLWVRDRGTRRGAMVGAIVGGLSLAAFGGFVAAGLCEKANGCAGDIGFVIAGGLALGAGGGAVVGAGLGSLARRWRRLYP